MTRNPPDALAEMLRVLVAEEVARQVAALKPAPADALLSTRAAADLAGVEMGTIRRWIREGRLKRRAAGRHLRVSRAELERLIASPGRRIDRRTPEQMADEDFA